MCGLSNITYFFTYPQELIPLDLNVLPLFFYNVPLLSEEGCSDQAKNNMPAIWAQYQWAPELQHRCSGHIGAAIVLSQPYFSPTNLCQSWTMMDGRYPQHNICLWREGAQIYLDGNISADSQMAPDHHSRCNRYDCAAWAISDPSFTSTKSLPAPDLNGWLSLPHNTLLFTREGVLSRWD